MTPVAKPRLRAVPETRYGVRTYVVPYELAYVEPETMADAVVDIEIRCVICTPRDPRKLHYRWYSVRYPNTTRWVRIGARTDCSTTEYALVRFMDTHIARHTVKRDI